MDAPTPDPATPSTTRADLTRLCLAAGALSLLAAAMWFAWLGWDHEYYLVDGVPQGPYRAWQVVGCGLTIGAATVSAYLVVRGAATILVLAAAATVGVAVPWSLDASADDPTGMWGVGLLLLVVGGGLGLSALLALTRALVRSGRSTRRDLGVCGALTVLLLLVYAPLATVPFAALVWVFLSRWLPDRLTPPPSCPTRPGPARRGR